jgi:spermidine/putrescine transport system permease protein
MKALKSFWNGFKSATLPAYSLLAIVFLLTPIVYTIVFSFNRAFRRNTVWNQFTLDNWLNPCQREDLCQAVGNSIAISVISTLVATALGTALAIALVRYRFKFKALVNFALFLPMATPEIVMGAGLAGLFFNAGVAPGLVPTILAHVMFCLSFVVVTVKARVQTLDPALEEAGRDLYANPSQVFWKITFPLLMPGIAAAALLSFALSFDDFIITYFNSGAVNTFPKFIYVTAKGGLPPQANVIASSVFLLAILIVLGTQISANVKRKRLQNVK